MCGILAICRRSRDGKRRDPDSRVAPWTDDYANILGAILDRKLGR
jgi:hypothetical protein